MFELSLYSAVSQVPYKLQQNRIIYTLLMKPIPYVFHFWYLSGDLSPVQIDTQSLFLNSTCILWIGMYHVALKELHSLKLRLAGDHLYGKLLFTWLSLVMSMMVSFCAVFFPTRCLGWDLELNWISFWGISYQLLSNRAETKKIHFFHDYQEL